MSIRLPCVAPCGCAKDAATPTRSPDSNRSRACRPCGRRQQRLAAGLERSPRLGQAAEGCCCGGLEEASNTLQPLARRSDLGYAKAEVSVDEDDFSARHDLVAHD